MSEQQPSPPAAADTAVVVVVVVCGRRVLIGRRADATPPWTLLGGKIEPGESAAAAAVREVREESGLQVTVTAELGERIHPDHRPTTDLPRGRRHRGHRSAGPRRRDHRAAVGLPR